MQISLTRFLILISGCFFFASCTTPKYLLPLPEGNVITLSKDNFKPIFKDNFKSFLFKSTLTYGDKFQQGGLLAIKQLSEGNYRTILMTSFGMTLFDFEFGNNGFVVHKVLEQMDRKLLLKIIEQDIEMLLSRDILGNKAIEFKRGQYPKEKIVLKTKLNGKAHFFIQEGQQKTTVIHQKRAVTVRLSEYLANIPRSIDIQHHNIPLSIKLTLLKH
ncbi:MAG: hypothetical protein ACI976_002787 [Aureispira sp.]|jgi:hypothetical protein